MYVLILTKDGLGYFLDYFFINSSGHPGCVRKATLTNFQEKLSKVIFFHKRRESIFPGIRVTWHVIRNYLLR
jgi:hypothetical protein